MNEFMEDVFLETKSGTGPWVWCTTPAGKQYGNYVPTILPLRYDAFIHLDRTRALHPLHIRPHGHQVPDTYPFGI